MVRLAAVLGLLVPLFALVPIAASACGWWGDGEMRLAFEEDQNSGAAGRSIPQELNPRVMRISGDNGFGVAVLDAARLLPYQSLTHGYAPDRIAGFKPYGIGAVIDLGTPDHVAALHERETEDAGMAYVNLPLAGGFPTPAETRLFADRLIGASGAPVLIYAPDARLLAAMWVAYRLSVGAPLEVTLDQGRRLGLSAEDAQRFRSEQNNRP